MVLELVCQHSDLILWVSMVGLVSHDGFGIGVVIVGRVATMNLFHGRFCVWVIIGGTTFVSVVPATSIFCGPSSCHDNFQGMSL